MKALFSFSCVCLQHGIYSLTHPILEKVTVPKHVLKLKSLFSNAYTTVHLQLKQMIQLLKIFLAFVF